MSKASLDATTSEFDSFHFSTARELKSVVRVKATCHIGGKEANEVCYYISSWPTDSRFKIYIRYHWEVENKFHWTLDMTFREEQHCKRSKMAAQNISLVRKFALNILKKDNSKLSRVNKRFEAAWNWSYMMQLLQI